MDRQAPTESERTFQYDDNLPPLPVPPLQQTLGKYLDAVKPFLNDEEFQETKQIVDDFGKDLGPKLQEQLFERAKTHKNWLTDWWNKMYHETRIPLPVLQNFGAFICGIEAIWPQLEGTQLKRGAIFLYHQMRFYELLRKEQVPVEKNRLGTTVLSMIQYRSLVNQCRQPGVERDSAFGCFKTEREGKCPNHVHVMCNGHIFKLSPFDKEGQLLTAPEIYRQLAYIKGRCAERGQCIATLTADDRASYAKALAHLVSLDPVNQANFDVIQSSIIGFGLLDDEKPATFSELCFTGAAGKSPHNRWYDSSSSTFVTQNGIPFVMTEHSAYDGMTTTVSTNYVYEQIKKNNGEWPEDQIRTEIRSDLEMPTELIFTIDEKVKQDIEHARRTFTKLSDNFEVDSLTYTRYGKEFLKKQRIHPDTCIQLALQLAYATEFGRPGACYETATARQFYRGRTETMRTCTVEAYEWCKAMLNPKEQPSRRLELFRRAHDKHNKLIGEAAKGQGIDRHLLGLYNICEEMGLPAPELYADKAWTRSGGGGNFPLSTSCMGYTPVIASLAPMMEDGVMSNYRIGKEDLTLTLSAFKSSSKTNATTFVQQINTALDKIGALFWREE